MSCDNPTSCCTRTIELGVVVLAPTPIEQHRMSCVCIVIVSSTYVGAVRMPRLWSHVGAQRDHSCSEQAAVALVPPPSSRRYHSPLRHPPLKAAQPREVVLYCRLRSPNTTMARWPWYNVLHAESLGTNDVDFGAEGDLHGTSPTPLPIPHCAL